MKGPQVATERIALVVVVLLADLFFSGVVFGWAPLLLLLVDEQQYGELCRDQDDIADDSGGAAEPCVAQENRLNLMFALAAVATNAASLPVGVFLDRYGPKTATALAGVVQVVALLLMAVADSKRLDVFVPAYVLMAIGGTVTMMASYPASFLILRHQTAILAAISCLFDGSSVVFLLLYGIRSVFRTSRFVLFSGYACFAVLVYSLMFVLWGMNEKALLERHDSLVENEQDSENENGDSTEIPQSLLDASKDHDLSNNSPVSEKAAKQLLKCHYVDYGTLNEAQLTSQHDADEIHALYRTGLIESKLSDEMSVRLQLQTFEFGYILVFARVHVLRASVFIGTANKLLLNYGDAMRHFLYTKIFSLVLPLGFVFVPAIDFLVERPRGLTLSLMLTNALGFVYNVAALIEYLPLQCLTFVVFTGFRAFLYAVASAYAAKTFGLKNLGTLMGIIFSAGSLLSLLEYPAVYLSNLQADGDLSVVYWLSLVACVVLIPLTEFHRRREASRAQMHRQLLSRFGLTLLSPDVPHGESIGLSYRRSPPLTTPETTAITASGSASESSTGSVVDNMKQQKKKKSKARSQSLLPS